MKNFLKHFLIIACMFTALNAAHAQTVPPIKQRTNSGYQQVDDYLIAPKRLGIPTGTSDNLDAVVAPANTIKLLYRTDINTLRAYNPITGLWSNAVPGIDESTLLHKTGDEIKDGALTVNTLFSPNVSVNSNEPVGNFYVRGTSYLDVSNTGGVNFWGVGGVNNEGGIITGQALPAAAPGDNFDIVVKDLNHNGLLKSISKDSLNYIKASPATPQAANINIDGAIDAASASFHDGQSHVYVINEANGYTGLAFGAKDGPGVQLRYQPNALGRGLVLYDPQNPSNTGIGNSDWRRVLVHGEDVTVKSLIINTADTATSDFEILARDKTTGEVKQLGADGYIKASPATPQVADINTQGTLNLNGGYIDGVSAVYVRGESGQISSATIGTNKLNAEVANIETAFFDVNSTSTSNTLFFFDGTVDGETRKYSRIRTDDGGFSFGSSSGTNLFSIQYDGKIAVPVTPAPATSNFELLARDKTTGEVKKIDLADLKAMLNNIQ